MDLGRGSYSTITYTPAANTGNVDNKTRNICKAMVVVAKQMTLPSTSTTTDEEHQGKISSWLQAMPSLVLSR